MVLYKDSAPELRVKTNKITIFDAQLRNLILRMSAQLSKWRGYALSTPQIGRAERFFVADVGYIRGGKKNCKIITFCNPIITKKSEDEINFDESCLSFPGKYVPIKRPGAITVSFQNEHGQPRGVHVNGLLARVIQHEIDHLDGKLIIDYGELSDLNS